MSHAQPGGQSQRMKCYRTSLSSIRGRIRVCSHWVCPYMKLGWALGPSRSGLPFRTAPAGWRKGPGETLVNSGRILWSAAAGRINPSQWHSGGAGREQGVRRACRGWTGHRAWVPSVSWQRWGTALSPDGQEHSL